MKRKGQVNGVLALSIGLILTVVILSVVFAFLAEQTSRTAIEDDQFTASNTSCVRVTTNCISSLTSVVNATAGTDATGNFSVCTVSGTDSGLFLDPTDSQGNIDNNAKTVNASYSEQSCGYITSNLTRTIVLVIPVLLAIALLIFAAGFLVLKR